MGRTNFKKTIVKTSVKKPGIFSKFKKINWKYVRRWIKSGTLNGARELANEFKTEKDPQILQVLWHNGHKQMVFSLFNGIRTGEYDRSVNEAAKSQLKAKPTAKEGKTALDHWNPYDNEAPKQISRPKNITDELELKEAFREMFGLNL